MAGLSLSSVLNQGQPGAAPRGMLAQAGNAAASSTPTAPGKGVTLTENAARQVRALMQQQGRDPANTYLRMGVKGGGCSGLSYTIDLADRKDSFDVEFDAHGLKLVVDRKSLIYLAGMQLDFGQGLKAGWIFGNPNQKKACSCGESFAV